MHLGPFHYCVKLGANRAELVQLMQKFVQRSRVGIFHNEGTRSISLNLNSCSGAFRNIWVHLGTFHYSMKLDAKLAELVQLMQNIVQRSRVRIFGN